MYRNGLEFLQAAIPKFHRELIDQFAYEVFSNEHPEAARLKVNNKNPEQTSREIERMLDFIAWENEGADQAFELIGLLIGLRRTGETMERLAARLINDIKAGALGQPETKDT